MFRTQNPISNCLKYGAVLGLLLLWGCQPTTPPTHDGLPEAPVSRRQHSDWTGEDILKRTIERYQSATAYSDRAVLYLSYQLEGRSLQEPQPWAFHWQSDENRYSAQLFNSQILGDGNWLSCYVYDIDSGNLDNQQLVLPEQDNALNQLLDDEIARHFVAGYDDLPVRKTDAGQTSVELLPPTVDLLTGQFPRSWLRNPISIERLADDAVDGVPCFVLRLTNEFAIDVWIDQESLTIWQLLLPIQWLDPQVLSSQDVTELQLIARFHEVKFDDDVAVLTSKVELKPDATPVSRFVKIPDPLPTELIGQPANPFQLISADGKPVTGDELIRGPTLLVWPVGRTTRRITEAITDLQRQRQDSKTRFILVFPDIELTAHSSWGAPADEWKSMMDSAGVEYFLDSNLDASAALRIATVPAAIYLDGQQKIHFAMTLGESNWTRDLKAALRRLENGDDLATEMLDEYHQFLESYHAKKVQWAQELFSKRDATSAGKR